MKFVGIDPGLMGSACAIEIAFPKNKQNDIIVLSGKYILPFWKYINKIEFYDFSKIIIEKNNKKRRVKQESFIDVIDFNEWLQKIGKVDCFFLEGVHSMPNDSHMAAFKFGSIYGAIKTTILLSNQCLKLVPINWKSNLVRFLYDNFFIILNDIPNELPANSKEFNIYLAKNLLEKLINKNNTYFTKKKHHNRADAFLILFWALIEYFNINK